MKRIHAYLFALALLFVSSTAYAVDLTVTAASVVPDSGYGYKEGTAGATITAGQVVYQDSTDSDKFKLSQCDGTAAEATLVGVALHGAASGQPIRVMTSGTVNIGATVTVGQVYAVSATAGGIAPYADLGSTNRVSLLGVGTTTAKIKFGILNSGVQKP